MPSRRKKISLRALSQTGPTIFDFDQITTELTTSTDRNAVILASSGVEWHLGQLLIDKLPNTPPNVRKVLFEQDGALSTFSAKCHLGFALNLYGDNILHDLEIIRHIRNAFAHAPKPISLRTREVSRECKKLYLGKDPEYDELLRKHGIDPSVTSRGQFVMACAELTVSFVREQSKLLKAENRRLKYQLKKLNRGASHP